MAYVLRGVDGFVVHIGGKPIVEWSKNHWKAARFKWRRGARQAQYYLSSLGFPTTLVSFDKIMYKSEAEIWQ